MKTIPTLIRHLLTFLAGLGTILAAKGWIQPDQTEAVNAAGSQLVEPLTVVLAGVAVVLARAVLALVGRIWSGPKDEMLSLAIVGVPLLWLCIGFAALSQCACTTTKTDPKSGVVTVTRFEVPAEAWTVIGQAVAKKAPVVRAEK